MLWSLEVWVGECLVLDEMAKLDHVDGLKQPHGEGSVDGVDA